MNSYRVVIFDENQKVLISKVVTDADTKENITSRIKMVIDMHNAPFTVSVTDYIHETMSVFDFAALLNTALEEMRL